MQFRATKWIALHVVKSTYSFYKCFNYKISRRSTYTVKIFLLKGGGGLFMASPNLASSCVRYFMGNWFVALHCQTIPNLLYVHTCRKVNFVGKDYAENTRHLVNRLLITAIF